MKSRSAHCDLELADAVRQFPLRSAAGDTRTMRTRRTRRRRRTRRMRTEDVHPRVTLIKSSNPHLAGGEKCHKKWTKDDVSLRNSRMSLVMVYIYIYIIYNIIYIYIYLFFWGAFKTTCFPWSIATRKKVKLRRPRTGRDGPDGVSWGIHQGKDSMDF